jgi:hypothetical protein
VADAGGATRGGGGKILGRGGITGEAGAGTAADGMGDVDIVVVGGDAGLGTGGGGAWESGAFGTDEIDGVRTGNLLGTGAGPADPGTGGLVVNGGGRTGVAGGGGTGGRDIAGGATRADGGGGIGGREDFGASASVPFDGGRAGKFIRTVSRDSLP